MLPNFFIDRPIFAWVIAIIIVLGGLLSLRQLPVAAYPSVAAPALTINVSYPGASAKVIEETAVALIEQELNGIENLLYMESASEQNLGSITLSFKSGTNLDRASVAEARCLVAYTDDELTNVAACAQARRMNPSIRTVARCFDDALAQRLGGFGIDSVVSMSRAAAGAFVGAAIDERAARHITLGDLELVAFRHSIERDVTAAEVAVWRDEGARVLAVLPPGGHALPPVAALDGLARGSVVILAGPELIVQRFLDAE